MPACPPFLVEGRRLKIAWSRGLHQSRRAGKQSGLEAASFLRQWEHVQQNQQRGADPLGYAGPFGSCRRLVDSSNLSIF
ncbi:hypothetical protein TRIP_B200017 [uncultured Desulfatiglans sp.]|nr:hypothetical protein TRIP_B200017 [uncultured Desulfatiglans sp.]